MDKKKTKGKKVPGAPKKRCGRGSKTTGNQSPNKAAEEGPKRG